MTESDKEFRAQALKWLREQPRTQDEIADKMLQISQVSISIAEEHWKKNAVSQFMFKALGEILKPPSN